MDATLWLWTQQGLRLPWLHSPATRHSWLSPYAASIAVYHSHLVGWPVTRKAIPLPVSPSQEVQPPSKFQYNTPGLFSTGLRLWKVHTTAPWASLTPRSSTALLLSAHPARLSLLGWHCSPALLCLTCRDGNSHILKLKHQAPQSDTRQSAEEKMGPGPLSTSASPCLLIHKCWRSLNLSSTMSWSFRLLFSLYLCGLKSVTALVPLSAQLLENYLICVLPSLLPSFTTAWFMALDPGSSTTQLKSHILIIKRFRCFPVRYRHTVNNKMRAEQPQKHQRSWVFNFVPVTAALWHTE